MFGYFSKIDCVILFCLLGFFTQFKPSEPFITHYLVDYKNFTLETVNNEIYPVWTYSYLSFLAVVGPLTEIIGYKTMIVTQVSSHVATSAILIWGTSLQMMQLMQVTYGLASAADVSYYSYIYRLVSQDRYQKVTGYTRASTLIAHTVAGILGQVIIMYGVDYPPLYMISFISVIVALFISFTLPSAKSILVYDNLEEEDEVNSNVNPNLKTKISILFENGKKTLFTSYSNKQTVIWSIWWALIFCGLLSFEGYASSVWYKIDPDIRYNGFCDSFARLLGTVGSLLPNWIPASFLSRGGEIILCLSSVLFFAFSWIMGWIENIWISYLITALFSFFIYFAISIAAARIALELASSKYALVFGINTFVGLVLQTIFQVFCSTVFNVTLEQRFFIYAGFFLIVAFLLLISILLQFRLCQKRNEDIQAESQNNLISENENENNQIES